ncbi:MAG: YihY/virulence factor BrkB family protein [Oscillospiraceae bacterium]|nr:YihY/virulence factor BrkB family protein [Oscillospiraceae bacterium]
MNGKILFLGEKVIKEYLKHHVSRASAALAYFLMLTVFPLLICLYAMLGNLFPSAQELSGLLRGFLPVATVDIIMEFLGYVSANSSLRMVSVALVAMATSSAAGFRIIDKLLFELREHKVGKGMIPFAFSFLFSLVFLAALYLSAVLMVSGGWFISFADKYIKGLNISQSWEWFRFIILFMLLYVMIMGVYKVCSPRGREVILVPGAFFAAVATVLISILFSWFIGLSVKYPLVYGSLASVMIMMFWLYICGNIVFIGGLINIGLEGLIQSGESH